MVDSALNGLVEYGMVHGLLKPEDRDFARNGLLACLQRDACDPAAPPMQGTVEELLQPLVDDAVSRGLCGDSVTERDLFDTRLMGVLTPRPSEVAEEFRLRYELSPQTATDWFYRLCQDTNYIRAARVARDEKWQTATPYGELEITINLSKPEKDPRAIAAARTAAAGYPCCQLCPQNVGYAGRLDHPARQNLRVIPLLLDGGRWGLQYSPYSYYPEHCIVFNWQHTPMRIEAGTFRRLLDFVRQFPHYFVGSNADLPIVGGSILSHDHFQGGRHDFAMARAGVEIPFTFPGYADVEAGILHWPMSVVRLRCADERRLVQLADAVLQAWRQYSDLSVEILAQTDGTPHNTITPIARKNGADYELDLVLRNNRTTPQHPLGLFHPHAPLHHIKKENIGLIEVMGLAVLPARLKGELAALADALLAGKDLTADERLAKHAAWAEQVKAAHPQLNAENIHDVLRQEVGEVFLQVLKDAGVFACTPEGRQAFVRFLRSVR